MAFRWRCFRLSSSSDADGADLGFFWSDSGSTISWCRNEKGEKSTFLSKCEQQHRPTRACKRLSKKVPKIPNFTALLEENWKTCSSITTKQQRPSPSSFVFFITVQYWCIGYLKITSKKNHLKVKNSLKTVIKTLVKKSPQSIYSLCLNLNVKRTHLCEKTGCGDTADRGNISFNVSDNPWSSWQPAISSWL